MLSDSDSLPKGDVVSVEILGIKPYGIKEFGIQDLDGHDIAFGQRI